MERRLPLWQAAIWVVSGGVAAQLVGGFVSALLRAWVKAHPAGAPVAGIDARTVVPVMFASSCTLIVVAVLAPVSAGLSLRRALNLRPAALPAFVAAALGTVMLGPTADVLMRALQAALPQLNLGVVAMLHDLVAHIPVFVAWPVFALMPGVAEELVFRGLLQTAAQRRWVGISASALAFALFHIDPQHIVGVLPLGFFLAWVGSRCGTVVTIFAHVVNNTAAILAVHSEALDVGYGTDAEMPWTWVPASLLLVVLAVRVIAKHAPPPLGGVPYTDPHAF